MPESTLSLNVNDFKAEIGHYLGYGRGPLFSEGTWDVPQTNNITAILKSGLSQVYTPPPLSDGEPPHSWSFLRPLSTLVLLSGHSTVKLPDGFGGFEEPLNIMTPATARSYKLLRVTHIAKVEQMHALEPDTTGAPRLACEKVLPGTGALESSRSELYVWPKADADYTLTGVWKHLPDLLTGSYPYAPGGSEHSELFKASCIACAALQIDDEYDMRYGAFMRLLAASVHADRKRKGQYIGYNGDRSDNRQRVNRMPGWARYYDNSNVTYNGDVL